MSFETDSKDENVFIACSTIFCAGFGHRKLDTATSATVDGMLSAGAQPTMVVDMLHRNNIMVSTRDVYNMRQQSKFKGIHPSSDFCY